MAKSIYQFWLNNGKSKIRLPVNPETLSVDNGLMNERIKVADFGEVAFINKPGNKSFSFSVLLPKDWFPSCEYKGFPKPRDIEKRLNTWANNKDTIQFIVTGNVKINMKVSIESLNFLEGTYGVGDLVMNITLQEYKVPKPRTIKVKKPIQSAKAKAKKPVKKVVKPRPKPKQVNKTYTVKSGDTLWAIATRYYGNGLQWKKIWNNPTNKKMMIARDSRNTRMPGHWIFPGQKLIIPK